MNQHDVSVHASERMHPMDVIVRAVETEGIQELLNRLKKRDIQRLLRECANSETKPEGSKRALRKELEQKWVSVGVKKFLKKYVHSHHCLNMLAAVLSIHLVLPVPQQPTAPSTSPPQIQFHVQLTDRISMIEAITRDITTLGNQIFHQKVPNEDVLSFIAKQKQEDKKCLSPDGDGRKKGRTPSRESSLTPRSGTTDTQTTPTSPRKAGAPERRQSLSPSVTTSTTLPVPTTPEKPKKQKKQEGLHSSSANTRVKQPKIETK